jgi:hypothetical protein
MSPVRVAAAAARGTLALDLSDRVHRERARPLEPELVAGAAVENEEGVRVARGAVAEIRALSERPRAPGQLAAGECEPSSITSPSAATMPGAP